MAAATAAATTWREAPPAAAPRATASAMAATSSAEQDDAECSADGGAEEASGELDEVDREDDVVAVTKGDREGTGCEGGDGARRSINQAAQGSPGCECAAEAEAASGAEAQAAARWGRLAMTTKRRGDRSKQAARLEPKWLRTPKHGTNMNSNEPSALLLII